MDLDYPLIPVDLLDFICRRNIFFSNRNSLFYHFRYFLWFSSSCFAGGSVVPVFSLRLFRWFPWFRFGCTVSFGERDREIIFIYPRRIHQL